MRIAILADLHLGYERFREDAYRQAYDAVEKASGSADIILIAGDIFDFRHPKPDVIAEGLTIFRMACGRMNGASVKEIEGEAKDRTYTEIPIIAIPGTHERRASDATDAVDLLAMAGLIVDAGNSKVTVEGLSGERVSIHGIAGTSEERFGEMLKVLSPSPDEGAFNVLMFHQSLYELLPFSEDFLRMEELPGGFDLYVDGHIHNRVEKKCHGADFLIPGSTVLTQLKEGEQEGKGFFIYDTRDRSYSFNGIRSRRFVVVRENVEGKRPREVSEETEKKIESIISSEEEKPIIRVELEGRLMDGFRSSDLEIQGMGRTFANDAFIEIAKGDVKSSETDAELEDLRSGTMDNISIKDYGLSIFLGKLKEKGYGLAIGPSALFEILSSDKKEVAIKEALDKLL